MKSIMKRRRLKNEVLKNMGTFGLSYLEKLAPYQPGPDSGESSNMAQLPSLDNAPINFASLREQAQKDLVDILDSVRGKKALVLDQKLSGSLALVAQISLLKEHGVENLYHLTEKPVQTECKNVVYLVRPRMNLMKLIAANIQDGHQQAVQRQYSVIFLPRRTIACEKILEDEGVHGDVTIGEFPLYMIPFDDDVLSLELDQTARETQVEGDTGSLWYVARAINQIQSNFGVIPNIRGKGSAAAHVASILNRMQREQPVVPQTAGPPEIDTLILLDRQVDMVTPMFLQLTYEGLIDEFLSINNGAVELESTIVGGKEGTKKGKVPLNSNDRMFRELRDLNFSVVGQVLRQKVTMIQNDYTGMHQSGQNQSVSELKDFVKKLNYLPELTRHTGIAQHLSTFTSKHKFLGQLNIEQTMVEGQNYDSAFEYVEEQILRQEPVIRVLRLLVLLSLTHSGLPKKHFEYLRREFLHNYGLEHFSTLGNLETAGLFKRQDPKNSWQLIRKALRLAVEDGDDANPTDISYVFSGYAPLSIRLVQQALKGGWQPIADTLRLIPGPSFEHRQGASGNGYAESSTSLETSSQDSGAANTGRRLLVLVVFIGGVTFAEISALRFLSAQEGMKYDLIVATTKLTNGSNLIQSFVGECV